MSKIYLDNNATTGVDPRVLEAMLPALSITPENPSSVHSYGRGARQKLLTARKQIATFLGVKEREILFNSGGTEGINTILHSIPKNAHIISSDCEHSAIFTTLKRFEEEGMAMTFLPAGLWGAIQADAIEKEVRPNTRLIILGAVNNETGVKIEMETIASLAERKGIPLAIDGVALLGKELFSIPKGVAAMAFSGHKFHAPKGVGFLFARSSFKLKPLLTGGDQEFSLRAGTENLAGILGLAKAVEILAETLPEATLRMHSLRERLEKGLKERLGYLFINGEGPRICNTTNLSFPDADGETLLMQLDGAGIAVSHGSACSSGALEPSRVLTNMGILYKQARSSLRFSLSRWNTEEEIDRCIDTLSSLILRQRTF